ncbi:MAG: TIM barrel protein [Clostridia bacterium]|nr:TIM barrel protein [Clostridia bacterium]
MKLGFGANIWLRDNHLQDFNRMLDDFALLGFDGIEFYYFAWENYRNRVDTFSRLLDIHGIELSGYYAKVGFGSKEEFNRTLADVKDTWRFARDVGSKNAILDEWVRDRYDLLAIPEEAKPDRIKWMADTANELGEWVKSMGMQMSFHNHWGSIFDEEKLFHDFMAQTDPNLVHFCIDTAQAKLCGWDEVENCKRYANRMSYVHFKDVNFIGRKNEMLWEGHNVPDNGGGYTVDSRGRMIELGRGEVRLKDCWEAMKAAGFDGWIVDDHDHTGYAAYDSAKACKDYLNYALNIWGEKEKDKRK